MLYCLNYCRCISDLNELTQELMINRKDKPLQKQKRIQTINNNWTF